MTYLRFVLFLCCLQKAQSRKGKAAEKSPQNEQAPSSTDVANVAELDQRIADVGNKIRQLKAAKAPKASVLFCIFIRTTQCMKKYLRRLQSTHWLDYVMLLEFRKLNRAHFDCQYVGFFLSNRNVT